jgi:RNA polymerase sigma-54 factor
MVQELRAYEPKPGSLFAADAAEQAAPDVFVRRTRGGFAVELNSAALPRLLVNRRYYQELKAGPQDKASKAWLSECLASANWLVRALDQRARTIVKVVSEIVKKQAAFFEHGPEALKALTLRQVAEAIEMHESTVSRVTSNKYLLCDRGMFELKYFFSSGVASTDAEGEGASAEAVKTAIRDIVDRETEVLSDDAIAALLKQRGFDCARRTVVKYRESMGIGSSVQRRRQRKIAGLG